MAVPHCNKSTWQRVDMRLRALPGAFSVNHYFRGTSHPWGMASLLPPHPCSPTPAAPPFLRPTLAAPPLLRPTLAAHIAQPSPRSSSRRCHSWTPRSSAAPQGGASAAARAALEAGPMGSASGHAITPSRQQGPCSKLAPMLLHTRKPIKHAQTRSGREGGGLADSPSAALSPQRHLIVGGRKAGRAQHHSCIGSRAHLS